MSELKNDNKPEHHDKSGVYEQAKRQALEQLEQGFHLGGKIAVNRDELHKR